MGYDRRPRSGVHRVSVKFGGVLLDCEGHYYRGFDGDRIDPPEPELFEFTYVKHREEDVYGLLGDDMVQELAEQCICELKARLQGEE